MLLLSALLGKGYSLTVSLGDVGTQRAVQWSRLFDDEAKIATGRPASVPCR